MSYKTILVHVDQSSHAAARIRIAVEVAAEENAHLVGVAMAGISRYLPDGNGLDLTNPALRNHIDLQNQVADGALAQFERIAELAGLTSYERRRINDGDHEGLCLQARYCDLVVLGQAESNGTSARILLDLPEYVVLNSGRPVLIIPHSGTFDAVYDNRVLVAWDGSKEATRAVTDAIPLLRLAKSVVVVVINASIAQGNHGEEPGADIALFLARHQIKVEVMTQATSIDVGNALLSLTASLGMDLIVMGGYGHVRFREILLGGVTKTVLEAMPVPVLMSH